MTNYLFCKSSSALSYGRRMLLWDLLYCEFKLNIRCANTLLYLNILFIEGLFLQLLGNSAKIPHLRI